MTLTDERPDKSSQRRNSVEVVTASNYRLDRLTFPFHVFFSFPFLFFLFLFFRHASTTAFNNNIRIFEQKVAIIFFSFTNCSFNSNFCTSFESAFLYFLFPLSFWKFLLVFLIFSPSIYWILIQFKFQLWIFWILGTTSYACSNWTICSFNFP